MDLSPRMLEGFKAVSGGVDPRELFDAKNSLVKQRGQEAVDQLISSWRSYRASIITGFMKETRSAIEHSRPGTIVSAAVKPDIKSAFEIYGQDWPRWVRERICGQGSADGIQQRSRYGLRTDQCRCESGWWQQCLGGLEGLGCDGDKHIRAYPKHERPEPGRYLLFLLQWPRRQAENSGTAR